MKHVKRNLLIFLMLLALVTVYTVPGETATASASVSKDAAEAYTAQEKSADGAVAIAEADGDGDGADKGNAGEGGTDQGGTDQGDTDQGGTDQGGSNQGGSGEDGDDGDDGDDPDDGKGDGGSDEPCDHYVYCDNPTKCARCGRTVQSGEAHLRHVGDDEHDGGGRYEYNATSHWWVCGGCGEHLFVGVHYADCNNAAACYECGATGVTMGRLYHEFVNGACIYCGTVETTDSASSSKKPSSRTQSSTGLTGSVTTSIGPDMYDDGETRALVYAPKTGKASLRKTASGSSQVLRQLLDGTVVIVLNKGARYTEVSVDGRTGYILTGALEMIDPDLRPIGEAMLTYPGTGGRGTTTINVRTDPSSKARKIDEWPTGTTVVVWSVSEKEQWYEVEYDGVRNYVQAQFVTMTTLYDYDMTDEDVEEEEDDYDDYDDYDEDDYYDEDE